MRPFIISTCIVSVLPVPAGWVRQQILFDGSPIVTRALDVWLWFGMAFGFASMWTVLGLFTRFHIELIEASGELNWEVQWGFGQVMALGTWASVIVDFFFIWICK
jgi:hypothetical protein